MKITYTSFPFVLLGIIIFSLIFLGIQFAQAGWSAPSGKPSASNNAPAPINVSSTNQSKAGSLTVKGFRNNANLYNYGTAVARSNGWGLILQNGSAASNASDRSRAGSIYANDMYIRSAGRWLSDVADDARKKGTASIGSVSTYSAGGSYGSTNQRRLGAKKFCSVSYIRNAEDSHYCHVWKSGSNWYIKEYKTSCRAVCIN